MIKKFSPNFSSQEIPVEFLVIHYTACNLADTLLLFCSPEKKVCAHFVIDWDGCIYDLGDFWSGPIRLGAHAGKSFFDLDGQKWEGFNYFSIGIEIVNFNGNLFPYPFAQYASLVALTQHLGSRFPILNSNPNRVVGHEHIAGFRGKVDPGQCFDWHLFYSGVYPDRVLREEFPPRPAVLNAKAWDEFERTFGKVNQSQMKPSDWALLSSRLEAFVGKMKGIK